MKGSVFCASIALALSLGSANQVLAQDGYRDQFLNWIAPTGPTGTVGWSSPASLCQLLPGSAPSIVDYATGGVTFAANSFGTIGLACPMQGTMNGVLPKDINQVALRFSNPTPAAGCAISVYFVDRFTGLNSGWASDKSHDLTGVWTANIWLNGSTSPATQHTYDVDVYLFRPQSAETSCNPVAFGMFMEAAPPPIL